MLEETEALKGLLKTKDLTAKSIKSIYEDIEIKAIEIMREHGIKWTACNSYSDGLHIHASNFTFNFLQALDNEFAPYDIEIYEHLMKGIMGNITFHCIVILLKFKGED